LEHNIIHEQTAPYSSFQNGICERFNRTLLDMTLCMLFEFNVPLMLWGEAIVYSVYIINRIPSAHLDDTTSPYFMVNGVRPSVKNLVRLLMLYMTHLFVENLIGDL
jgi:transposase InsO family protein